MADDADAGTVSISPTEYDVFFSFRGKENFTSHIMADDADADAGRPGTVSIPPTEYDVFLSFRGKENFTSHLYTALIKAGFRTFLGDGGEVSSIHRSELNEAILESRVFIIVFSQSYSSSRCCLDDLLTILSCKRRYGRAVIPVFLSVDPSDVRHQTGSIAEAMKFVRHEEFKSYTEMDRKTKPKLVAGRQEEFKSYTEMDRETIRIPPKRGKIKARVFEGLVETIKSLTEMGHITKEFKSYTEMDHKTKQKLMAGSEAKIGKWREALTEAGNLSGIYLGNIDHDPEEKLIKKMVEGIVEEVSTFVQGLVGVHTYKRNIEDWENAPQKKTVVSHARFHDYENPRTASLPDHYDKSLITDNTQLMTSNLLPDSVREISRLQSLALLQLQGTKLFQGVVLENHPARSSFDTYNAKRSWYEKNEKMQDNLLSYEIHSDILRLVAWGPHKKIPIPTQPFINMVDLDMSYNKLEQAWQGIMFLPSLKILNLSHSKYLWRTPDFSGVLNLKSLIFEGCASLVKVSETIGLVERLTLLNLEDCKSLTNLPRSICTLPCLETLILSGCSSLEFTMELRNLKSLKEFLAKDTGVLLLNSHQTDRMKTNTQVSAYIPQPNGLYLKLGNLELTETPKAEEWDTKEIHLMNNRLSELPDNPKCPALEKLFLQSNYDLTEIPSTFFEYMPVLQVLDLSNTSIKSLSIPSISRLVELQELLLRGCELLMELPPEIGALTNLKVLDLEGTEIVYLPKELRELINLECLKVSLYGYADSYKESKGIDAIIPRTTLSKLTQLKELSINVDPYGEWWNVEVKAIFEELRSLRKLETLKLYVPTAELLQQFLQLEWNVDGLSLYSNLSHFRLIVGSQQQRLISRLPHDLEEEFLKLEKCLKYINGEGQTNQFAEALKHANTLFLDRHWSIEKLSVFKIDKLNELKDCLLVDCNEMHTVFDGSDFYEGDSLSLQNLHIYYLKNLEFIWKEPVVGSFLPHLKILALHMCPNLTTIVTPMLLQNLELLEEIIVEDCPKIETLVILDSSHPTLSVHSLQSLKKISLSDLPELVNIFSDQCIVPKLETMDIYDCPKLKILSSVEVCNKEIIKGEWWDALECNEPERSSADFSQLVVDQLAADGYSLRLFLKDRVTLQ